MLAGVVLVLFFLLFGPFWFQWAVFDLHWGRFGDGPFWSFPGHFGDDFTGEMTQPAVS